MAELNLRTINSLLGESFFVPKYQRGYRWTDRNVNDLLDDIMSYAKAINHPGKFYCLQPLAVQEKAGQWRVIDGQQRLTTIFIIIRYLMKEHLKVGNLKEDYGNDLYSITYETRKGSEHFLNEISSSDEINKDYIDYYYMSKAYQTVKEWFSDVSKVDRNDRHAFLSALLGKEGDRCSVQVIWYETDPTEKEEDLFSRLNMDKIQLTNAELIKAQFLSSSSFSDDDEEDIKKKEISLLWDKIELEMSDEDFWAFLTNDDQDDYENKIDLLFNVYTNKSKKDTDPLFAFLKFQDIIKSGKDLWDEWVEIEKIYETLREWYKDRESYHRIGYLISVGSCLHTLIDEAVNKKMRKNSFKNGLQSKISDYFNNVSIEELLFGKDNDKLHKLLVLLKSGNSNERYPFKAHKKKAWSLEHIHAQNSQSLTKEAQWREWLIHHKDSLTAFPNQEKSAPIYVKLQKTLEKNSLITQDFESLSQDIIELFTSEDTKKEDSDSMHGIGNLALLGREENSVLNNSVFEVKRRAIIELDKDGNYIPLCTRRLFQKYYTPKAENPPQYFWSEADRKGYIAEIKSVLKDYLSTENETMKAEVDTDG